MNYLAALTDFFKSPKWVNSLLLGGLCILIPVVGPIVVIGWHVSGFWGRKNPEDFASYPIFDFSNFVKYLERGVWPFLVTLVVPLLMAPVSMVMMLSFIPAQIAAGQSHGHEAVQALSAMSFMGFGLLWVVLFLVILLVMQPLIIVASITQDFASAFNWRRLKSFVTLMWPETLVSVLFIWFASFLLMVVGMAAFCVGIYFTMAVLYFVNAHLGWQLYHLYLVRGGEPIPLSPKLNDSPPPLPLASN